MGKKQAELDTPFRKGEKVIATRDLEDITSGTPGKIQLQNGIGSWKRYWVLFDGNRQVGQVDHYDLTRPWQLDAWMQREEDKANDALKSEQAAAAAESASDSGDAANSLIPAHLLERSRAAKARLLGS